MVDNQQLLQIVGKIYADLNADARKSSNGIFWETVNMVPAEHQILKHTNECIFNGVSGIMIFLMEYYKLTKDPVCLERIKQAAEWLIYFCDNNEITNVGFYSGRSGAAYTLIQLSLLTDDPDLIDKAENIISACNDYVQANPSQIFANFGSGLSGVLFVQLMLLDITQKESVLTDVKRNLDILLTLLRTNHRGIHFDEHFYARKPLISFPEGSSGIAHVLIHLGNYFNNDILIRLAHQLFDYENSCYSTSHNNWPDFANTEFFNKNRALYIYNYKTRNKRFFDVESDTVSWFSGAPSVGLSRVTAVRGGYQNYKNDVNKAVEKTLSFIKRSAANVKNNKVTLFSGLSGAGLFLLEVQRLNNHSLYSHAIEEVAACVVKQHEELSYFKSDYFYSDEVADNTLFTGECGVGYFLIQLLKPAHDISIVYPVLDLDKRSSFRLDGFNASKVYSSLLNIYYSRSFGFLKMLDKAVNLEFDDKPVREFHKTYAEYINNISDERDKLKSVFAFENQKNELIDKNDNFHFSYIKNKSLQEEYSKFLEDTDDKKLLKSRLCINESCTLSSYQNGEIKFIALKQMIGGVREMQLNQFAYNVFTTFNTPKSVERAISEIVKHSGAKETKEIEEIKKLTLDQIRQGLKVSLLNIKKTKFLGFSV